MPDYGIDLAYSMVDSNFSPHNERRWERVLDLLDTKDAVPCPPGDDRWIVDAYKFMLAMREANGDRLKQRSVARRWPALFAAFEIRTSANPVLRNTIDGLLGMRHDWQTVASQYGAPVSVIKWYTKLWWADFDPASDCPMTSFWLSTVQNPDALSPSYSSNNTRAFFLKLAFGSQPDTFWDLVENRELTEEGHARMASLYRSELSMKSVRAMMNASVGTHNAGEIMGHYLDFTRTQKELELQEQTQGGAMAELLHYCIRGASWMVMNRAEIPAELHQPKPNLRLLPSPEPAEAE